MSDPHYSALIDELRKRGIRAEFTRKDQLIMPKGVWVTWKAKWYISTWVPAVYPVPPDADIVALCLDCLDAEDGGGFYTIPERLTSKYRLQRLENDEIDRLFADFEDDDHEEED